MTLLQIEESNQEVCEDVYLVYTDLISQCASVSTDLCYRTYKLQSDCVLTMKETRKLISDGTTGLFTWEVSSMRVICIWTSFKEEQLGNIRVKMLHIEIVPRHDLITVF